MGRQISLQNYLAELADGGLCVAFSGGVDSAVLLEAANRAAPGRVFAVTAATPFHTDTEMREAADMATEMGIPHAVLEMENLPQKVMDNPPDRCYHCKKEIFSRIWGLARERGLAHVLDGTNADDLGQYRPGLAALRELGARSPLAELGLTKAQVRALAAGRGLAAAKKPSAPCLATRFPYDTPIDLGLLPGIQRVEQAVRELGAAVVRARVQPEADRLNAVRLEVAPEDFPPVLRHREELLQTAREAGFARLTLDLAGYRSGSFDDDVRKKGDA